MSAKKEFKFFYKGQSVSQSSGRALVLMARSKAEAVQAARDYGYQVDRAEQTGHGFDGTNVRQKTVVLPTFLASALINGDVTGLVEEDNKWLLKALELAKGGHYVDVGESEFSWRNDLPGFNLGADVATFTINYYDEKPSKKKPKLGGSSNPGLSRKSMTYGTLPSRTAFQAAFEKEVPDYSYEIRNDRRGRDGDYGPRELYKLLEEQVEAWNDGDEEAGDFCSAVLSTLGFEWI